MRKKRKVFQQIQPEPHKKLRKKRSNPININKLISEYLINCYIYYESSYDPVISDQEFDNLVNNLLKNFNLVEKSNHPHKNLVKEVSLKAYTGFGLSGKYPTIVKVIANQINTTAERRKKC